MKHINLSKQWFFGLRPFPAFRCLKGQGALCIPVRDKVPVVDGILPEGQFELRVKDNGNLSIHGRVDQTDRCLLMLSETGVEVLVGRGTSCQILGRATVKEELHLVLTLERDQTLTLRHISDGHLIVLRWNGSDLTRTEVAKKSDNYDLFYLKGNQVLTGLPLNSKALGPNGLAVAEGFEGTRVRRCLLEYGENLKLKPANGQTSDKRVLVIVESSLSSKWPLWDGTSKLCSKTMGSIVYSLVEAPPEWPEEMAKKAAAVTSPPKKKEKPVDIGKIDFRMFFGGECRVN